MDRDISLDAIKLVACIFVCTLHTIGMFMSESSDFHLSYLLFYGAQNETYIEGWEKKTSNLLIYKRLCKV